MREFIYRNKLAFIALILICSCKKDNNGEQPTTPTTPIEQEILQPTTATAKLPVNGEICTDYEEIENDLLNINVFVEWIASSNTDNYTLKIQEGTTEIYEESFTNTETLVLLQKAKTYSWYIISTNENGSVQSDTFSFTTPGISEDNYVPYAAEITIEFDSNANTMTTSWVGNDEDGDVLTYDIRILEADIEIISEKDLTNTFFDPITITRGVFYTAEVTSTDSFGNSSISSKTRKL